MELDESLAIRGALAQETLAPGTARPPNASPSGEAVGGLPLLRRRGRATAELATVVRWYFREVYGRHEGPGVLPFYCDPSRVGHFAVDPFELRAGKETALFRLFVALAMYQARRDVVIMRQQRSLTSRQAAPMISLESLARRARANPCALLSAAEVFDEGCSVRRVGLRVDCGERPEAPCHVKDAASFFNRMADLGKLPTSAWLRVWRSGGLRVLLSEAGSTMDDPRERADFLVERLSRVRRVGRKLATMFVSALSVPALAPGLTPWYPEVDGIDLVVVDTNVMRGLEVLARGRMPSSGYEGCVRWVREAAKGLDLRAVHPELPQYAPRLVQQALYAFCSRSNRVERQDPCLERAAECGDCLPSLCPLLQKAR